MPVVPTVAPRRRKVAAALWAAFGALLVAALGGAANDLGPWYAALEQPSWKPPDLWFGPAWTLIFTFTAVAGARAWLAEPQRAARARLVAAFVLNGVLNVGWSLLFFKLRRPDWALAEVALLWLSIVLLIVLAARSDSVAAWLLAPYLAWVTFAASINAGVVRLNGPF